MFSNFVIAAAGNLILHTHEDLRVLVEEHGGKYSEIVDDETTHLICGAFAYKSRTQKVESAIAIKSIKIVDVYWIEDSMEKKKAVPEEKYILLNGNHLATQTAKPEEKKAKKRSFDGNSDEKASDEAGPQTKRAREKETAKSSVMKESTKEAAEGIEKAVKTEQIIKFDLGWISETAVHVYRDQKKTPYEKWLSRVDVKKDTSTEIFVLQILETNTKPRKYALCCSNSSGVRKEIYGKSYTGSVDGLEGLITVYKSELKKRALQGYLHIDIDYSLERDAVEAAPSKKTLEVRSAFYNLLNLILSVKTTAKGLEARTAGYDKLVVKTISKSTIEKGKKILAMLKTSIADAPNTPAVSGQAGTQKATIQKKDDLAKLTSNYYGYIPHLFVGGEPIGLLDSHEKIKEEVGILGSLESIRTSAIMAKEINLQDNGHEDTLRKCFTSLNLNKIDIVDKDSQEFKHIKRYFVNTGGQPSSSTYALQIFRIERSGDEERWNKGGWGKKIGQHDNRRLLWHGTNLKSMHTILKEGLKDIRGIGGVYFSDTALTSICYSKSRGAVLGAENFPLGMLLCEVQLGYMSISGVGTSAGKFGRQRGTMNYKWTDAEIINKDLKGVQMPDVKKPDSLPYQHVEWVVTNPSQIKHRYLLIF